MKNINTNYRGEAKLSKRDSGKMERILSIDYLKAFAAILVILTHSLSKSQRLAIGGPFWISMAVPIFIILSGFTNSLSADKNKLTLLRDFYQKERLVQEFNSFLSPYFIIIVLEFFLGFYQRSFLKIGPFVSYRIKDYLLYFLTGGTTPGSYYIPIMLQFILIFPFLYLSYKQAGKKSVYFYLLLHFLFDLIANFLPIPTEIYRLLIFRYLGFIIVGIALYFSYQELRKSVRYMSFFSISYIIFYSLGYRIKMFSKWPNTALPTVFWALTIIIIGMELLEKNPKHLISNGLLKIGKASYYIFLIQKVLFGFGLNRFLNLMGLSPAGRSITAIIICCALGLSFYKLDKIRSV